MWKAWVRWVSADSPWVHKIEPSEFKQNVTPFHLLICNFVSRSSPFVSVILISLSEDNFLKVGTYVPIPEKVGSLSPNLIFMDIRLPGQSGLELTEKIKKVYPDITIIILTNYDIPEY